MASVNVRIEMAPGWEQKIKQLPPVKGAITKEAERICVAANSLSANFRTGKWHDHKTGAMRGNTKPHYGMKRTMEKGRTSVALVYTKNYAAMKDNLKNNTLAKAMK